MDITFLSGIKSDQCLVKTYSTDVAEEVVKISDYNSGKWFRHTTEQADNLDDVYRLFLQYGNGNYLRVHGLVADDYKTEGKIIRKSTSDGFLLEPPGGVRLFNLDIDGKSDMWRIDPHVDMKNKTEVQTAINKALRDAGLGFLLAYDFIFMWSQSAWTPSPLRCHLYWMLSSGVALQLLRDFGTAFNRVKHDNLLDTHVWVAAQPDFIGRRKVKGGLKEIFTTDTERLIYMDQGELSDVVPTTELEEFIAATIAAAEAQGTSGLLSKNLPSSWQGTLDRCGLESPDGDINGWAFRSAAQLVQEMGKRTVLENLHDLSVQMHERAWAAIGRNARGRRGDENDRNTYDIARFRQYLRSATDRKFGNETDASFDVVTHAIDLASQQGDVGALFCKDALDHAVRLMDRWPAKWAEVTLRIKTELNGVVSIADYRRAIGHNRKHYKSDAKGWGSEGGPDESSGGVQIIQEVISKFIWIKDQNNAIWAALPSEKVGGYQLFNLSGGLPELFYYMGQQITTTVPDRFGKTCISYVMGCLSALDSDFMTPPAELASGDDPFVLNTRNHIVSTQSAYRGNSFVLWDLGKHDNRWEVLVINEESNEIISRSECLERYNVLWFSNAQSQPRYVDLSADVSDLDRLWKYVLINEESRPAIIGWLVSVLFCSNTQFALELTGRHNSGKSHAGDALRDLTDPMDPYVFKGKNRSELASQSSADLIRSVAECGVLYLDNFQGLEAKLQKFLCQIATGILIPVRVLYTSTFDKIWLKKPVILTGIAEMITQTDLISRTIRCGFMSCATDKSTFSSDEELLEGWMRDRPLILGALAGVTQETLKTKSLIVGRRGTYNRAIEVVLGREAGTAHHKSENYKTLYDNVLSSPFCLCFGAFIQQTWIDLDDELALPHRAWLENYMRWTNNNWGRKTDILTNGRPEPLSIELSMGGNNTEKALPQSPRGLSAQLNKYEAELKEIMGIETDEIRGKFKSRVIKYEIPCG